MVHTLAPLPLGGCGSLAVLVVVDVHRVRELASARALAGGLLALVYLFVLVLTRAML